LGGHLRGVLDRELQCRRRVGTSQRHLHPQRRDQRGLRGHGAGDGGVDRQRPRRRGDHDRDQRRARVRAAARPPATDVAAVQPAPALNARALAALVLITAPLAGQRAGVLRQVNLPHPYYWREMYVPQVTSGPSAAAWSPDGRELIYSMQGTLWRQTIGDSVA